MRLFGSFRDFLRCQQDQGDPGRRGTAIPRAWFCVIATLCNCHPGRNSGVDANGVGSCRGTRTVLEANSVGSCRRERCWKLSGRERCWKLSTRTVLEVVGTRTVLEVVEGTRTVLEVVEGERAWNPPARSGQTDSGNGGRTRLLLPLQSRLMSPHFLICYIYFSAAGQSILM